MAKDKVISFGKYFQPMERTRARSRFIMERLRQCADESGLPHETVLCGGPDEEGLAEIFFQVELVSEELRAKDGSEK